MKLFKSAKAALEHIKIISNRSIRNEICGFLGYCTQSKQFVVKQAKNEANDPSQLFYINPLSYLLFKEDYEIIAVFHSHVVGDEQESDFDVKMSENSCLPFLIFSLNTQKINIYEPQKSDSDVNILERIKVLV